MKKTNLIEKIFLFTLPVAILAFLLIYLISGNIDFGLSYVLGVLCSLLMNSLNYRVMKNLYANNPELIKSRQIMLYIAKFIFFGVILYFTHTSEAWNVFYTFGGLMTYRIVSFPVALIFANKEGDEDA